MQTTHLFFFIHIGNKGEVGTVKHVSAIQYFCLLTDSRRCFFCESFLLFVFGVCHAVLPVHCNLVVICWERADLLALLYVMFSCASVTFPIGVLCHMWYLIY